MIYGPKLGLGKAAINTSRRPQSKVVAQPIARAAPMAEPTVCRRAGSRSHDPDDPHRGFGC
jgi:hypothetical protein